MVITNTGQTNLNNWVLRWAFSGNEKITQVRNATVFQQGQNVTLTNVPGNGIIGPGRSISNIGFFGVVSGRTVNPSNFVLNGVLCQ
jgi:hypothetical protein